MDNSDYLDSSTPQTTPVPLADLSEEDNLSLSTVDNDTSQMTPIDLRDVVQHTSYQDFMEAASNFYNQQRSTDHNATELLSPGLPIRRTRRRLNC